MKTFWYTVSVNKYKVKWGKDVCFGIKKILESKDVNVQTSIYALKLLFNWLWNKLEDISEDLEKEIRNCLRSGDKVIVDEALKVVTVIPEIYITK